MGCWNPVLKEIEVIQEGFFVLGVNICRRRWDMSVGRGIGSVRRLA
ncbi:MAG: hypothetical protein P8Y09_10785 [Deltaproteobacteria bacterium]